MTAPYTAARLPTPGAKVHAVPAIASRAFQLCDGRLMRDAIIGLPLSEVTCARCRKKLGPPYAPNDRDPGELAHLRAAQS